MAQYILKGEKKSYVVHLRLYFLNSEGSIRCFLMFLHKKGRDRQWRRALTGSVMGQKTETDVSDILPGPMLVVSFLEMSSGGVHVLFSLDVPHEHVFRIKAYTAEARS